MDIYDNSYKFSLRLFATEFKKDKISKKMLSVANKIYKLIDMGDFQEIGFGYSVPNKCRGEKQISKVLLNKPENIQKFLDIPDERLESTEFPMYLDGKKRIEANRIFDFRIAPSYLNNQIVPSFINIEFDSRAFDLSFFNAALIIRLIKYVMELPVELKYGVGFNLRSIKAPDFFSIGVTNNYLTKEEYRMARVLQHNIRNMKDKIWDIFDFNLIKKQLICGELLDEIKAIVTKESITEVGGFYLICLDLSNDYKKRDQELIEYRHNLRPVFKKYNLIMEYDNVDFNWWELRQKSNERLDRVIDDLVDK